MSKPHYSISVKEDGTWLIIAGGHYSALIRLEDASKLDVVKKAVQELRDYHLTLLPKELP